MSQDSEFVIDVQGLRKTFGEMVAVDDISLNVRHGEIFGFLGPNGSGKTTTMRMLCGLVLPDAGSGTCIGYDILSEQKKIKAGVGYVSQHFSLYADLTVRENLLFAARLNGLPGPEALVEQSIERHALNHYAKVLMGNLSGGWKQRVALALSTLHNPRLLILDEPTSGIDPEARQNFWNMIHQYAAEGLTVLVTTHYLDEAELHCERMAYIMDGRLLVSGSIPEVIASASLHMWRLLNAAPETEGWLQEQGGDVLVTRSTEGLLLSADCGEENRSRLQALMTQLGLQFEPFRVRLADVFMWLARHSRDHHS